MKIILRQDSEKLGKMGLQKDVSVGYYRNYLFPKGLAYPAEKKYLAIFENEKKIKESQEKKKETEAIKIKEKIEKISISIPVKVGQEEKIFGSVTCADISSALKKEGVEIDKRNIIIDEEIKSLGVYTITVKVYKGIEAKPKIWVVKENS